MSIFFANAASIMSEKDAIFLITNFPYTADIRKHGALSRGRPTGISLGCLRVDTRLSYLALVKVGVGS